jgi:hypothetical protein
MVLAALGLSPTRQRGPEGAPPQAVLAAQQTSILPVIHAGDRLIVEENTRVAVARLEAIAMGPALRGSPLNVRLSIGGNVVRAVALGPGRAAFAREVGSRP